MNRILLAFCCFFISFNSFGQSPKAIEANLLRSFKKIGYWYQRRGDLNGAGYDSLERSNAGFRDKLKLFTEKYPAILVQPFLSLQKERLDIYSSRDQMFRIYSWNTWLGGTMQDYNNVFQYKVGKTVFSILDTAKKTDDGEDYVYSYDHLYTFKTSSKIYYLAVYAGVFSTKDARHGIRVFTIENGKLNADVRIIKTKTGLHDRLFYDYDFFSVVDWKENGKIVDWKHRPRPTFDPVTQTIKLPLVDAKEQVTHKFITYKFTGKYFEKVKS